MDYEIDLPSLNSKKSELEGMKTTISNIESNYNGGYIKQLGSTEISSLVAKTTKGFERLTKGYNNSNDWFQRYVTEMDQLENNLSNFTSDTLTSPTVFKGEFMDIFTKVTIPAIKTDGDSKYNSSLGPGENMYEIIINGEKCTVVLPKGFPSLEEFSTFMKAIGLIQFSNGEVFNNGMQCLNFSGLYLSLLLGEGLDDSSSLNYKIMDMYNTRGQEIINSYNNSSKSMSYFNQKELKELNNLIRTTNPYRQGTNFDSNTYRIDSGTTYKMLDGSEVTLKTSNDQIAIMKDIVDRGYAMGIRLRQNGSSSGQHYVTVVGIKSSSKNKSASELSYDDFIYLNPSSGNITAGLPKNYHPYIQNGSATHQLFVARASYNA